MHISSNKSTSIKLLFVYKHNSQDPTERSLLNTFNKYIAEFHSFCFLSSERKRFAPENLSVSSRFIDVVTKFKPTHIFMWLVYLNPEEIQWCKDRNIKVVAAINGFASFSTGLFKSRDLYIKSLKLLDIFFIPHQPHLARMKKLGINVLELPFSFDPKTYKRLTTLRSMGSHFNKFFFVGNFGDGSKQCAYRVEMLKQVADSGKLLAVSDMKIQHKNIRHLSPISYEPGLNLLANFSKFLVCSDYFPNLNEYRDLNDSDVSDYDVNYAYAIRPRVYTMMGAGSPVIIERHDQLQRFFQDEEHLIMWSDYDELRDKLSYYDRNKTEYKKIEKNAYTFVNKHHTTDNRILEIILPSLIEC